jgi:membrane-associated phospholipid phosphatase
MLQTLLELDMRLSSRLRLSQTGSLGWRAVALLAHSGDSWFWASGLALLWLLSAGEWRRFAAISVIAIVLQALLVFPLKMTIRRQRPQGEWGSIYRTIDPHSFPSGHAARATLLVVLSIALGPPWLGWSIGLWAPLMALSRVVTGVHYLTDLLGGVLVGLVFGGLTLMMLPHWTGWFPFLF